MSRYAIDYERSFTIDAPCHEVWSLISRFETFPQWWSWLREFRVDGRGLASGSVLHGLVVAPIPYRMRLDVVLDQCVPPRRIEATVHGDLEGRACIVLEPDEERSSVTAQWTVEMMQAPMRIAARVAGPLLRWAHDQVVDSTVASFRRRVSIRTP